MTENKETAAQIPLQPWSDEEFEKAMDAHFKSTQRLADIEEDYKAVKSEWREKVKVAKKDERDRREDIVEQRAARLAG